MSGRPGPPGPVAGAQGRHTLGAMPEASSPGELTVGLVQLRVDDGEAPEARLSRVLAIIADLAGRADLVILPELWLHGAFATQANIAGAEPLTGSLVGRLSAAAREANIHLHAGSISESPPPGSHWRRPLNTSVVFDPAGRLVAHYRKIHLFGFDGGEAEAFDAGTELVVWDSPWGLIGLATCYDLRFPELFRALVDRGAQAFALPSGWPARRVARWDLLAQARAVENQAFVFGSNCVGTHDRHLMGGRSVVVHPTGEVLARAGSTDEEVLTLPVDMADAVQWRAQFPALRDRRL